MKIKKHKEQSKLIVYKGNELLVLHNNYEEKLKYIFINGPLKKEESPESALVIGMLNKLGVEIFEKDLKYQCSMTIDLKNNQRLSEHYFTYNKHITLLETLKSYNSKNIKWVPWENAIKFMTKTDQKVVKELFEPCNF